MSSIIDSCQIFDDSQKMGCDLIEPPFKDILNLIQRKKESSTSFPFIVAIDGRCASGKTTVSKTLSEALNAPVVHMDDFFLRPHQRTPERLASPGENIDHERFLKEVLFPLSRGLSCNYAPFSCSSQNLLPTISLIHNGIVIVEGSYAHHNDLRPYYNLCLFLTVDSEEQIRRIRKRNGENMARIFESKWIPMEEAYFEKFSIAENAHGVFSLR